MVSWLTECRPHELPQWDEKVRDRLSRPPHQFWTSHGWYGVQLLPDWWSSWESLVLAEPELLYVMACAPSGHVREQACQELRQRPTLRTLALLLVRSNDWVKAVRNTARAALPEFLRPEWAGWWVQCLPLVLRFNGGVRAPFPELPSLIKTFLESQEPAWAIEEGWQSPVAEERLALLELLKPAALTVKVETLLAGDQDVRVRRAFVPLASPSALRRLLSDSDSSVRASSVTRLLPQLELNVAVPELQRALLDTHSSVRWQVQYALRQVGLLVRDFYLNQNDAHLPTLQQLGFLGGLADVGKPEDTVRVVPYLDAAPRQQAEALRTLAALDIKQAEPRLWEALGKSGKVRQQAEQSLIQHQLLAEKPLQVLWRTHSDMVSRKLALRLAARLPRFEAMALLLEWRPEAETLREPMDEQLRRLLTGFGNRYFTRPTAVLQERMRVSLVNQHFPADISAFFEDLLAR